MTHAGPGQLHLSPGLQAGPGAAPQAICESIWLMGCGRLQSGPVAGRSKAGRAVLEARGISTQGLILQNSGPKPLLPASQRPDTVWGLQNYRHLKSFVEIESVRGRQDECRALRRWRHLCHSGVPGPFCHYLPLSPEHPPSDLKGSPSFHRPWTSTNSTRASATLLCVTENPEPGACGSLTPG